MSKNNTSKKPPERKGKRASNKNTASTPQKNIPFSPNRPGVEYRKVDTPSNTAPQPSHVPQKNSVPNRAVQHPTNRSTLNTNTPSRPRSVVPQPPNTKQNEDIARKRALEAHRKRIAKQARAKYIRQNMQRFAIISVFSLIGAFLCVATIFLVLKINFSKTDIPKELSVEIFQDKKESTTTANDNKNVNKDEKKENNTLLLDDSQYEYQNGNYYISTSVLSDELGISVTGDVKKMRLSFAPDQNATFTVGSTGVEINGTYITTDVPSYFSNGSLYVPASFFKQYCKDTTFESTKGDNGRVFRLTLPEKLEFVCSETLPTPGVEIPESNSPESETPVFKEDLSEYEMYMNPEDPDEYLVLINTSHMLDKSYAPTDLTDFIHTRKDRAAQKLRLYASKSLEAMFKEMYAHGYTDVTVTSGYRSYDYQTVLFNNEVASLRASYGENAEAKAAEAVAIPGSSEHQSGLCADLHNLSAASTAFERQEAYKWLYSNCANFGFILRFPKDKTDITGIMFEPWHYRYVGRYHAQKIMESGLCLEEYIEQYNNGN